MRRFALLFPLALIACSSKQDTPASTADAGDEDAAEVGLQPVPEWDKPVTPPSDDEAKSKRDSCGYAAGSLPAETQGKSFPTGKDIPIETIVIVMMENRSFDHYFAKLKDHGFTDVDVAPPDFSNPDKDGKPVPIFRDKQYCFVDTNHEWRGSHDQIGVGDKMDGFVKTNDGWSEAPPKGAPELLSGNRAMGYYDKDDLPFMYWGAENFALADKYFCALPGPTWPNRMYLYGASSYGRVTNKVPAVAVGDTIFDVMEKRGVSWTIYAGISPGATVFADRMVKYRDHIAPSADQYFDDAAAGKLAQVVFVDPRLGKEAFDQNDEHPPAMMSVGQAFLSKVTKALIQSPQWSKSALFITYDEHGGLWDHVPPPKACPPDKYDPEPPEATAGEKFDRYGMRVPFLVISPYAKKKYVGHHVYSHTSITRFIEAKFTLPALTGRDANAEAPYDMFDFASPPNASPAPPPDVPTDPTALANCKTIWTK
ncbi:MAG: phospholipase C [Polyangiales bacterium]